MFVVSVFGSMFKWCCIKYVVVFRRVVFSFMVVFGNRNDVMLVMCMLILMCLLLILCVFSVLLMFLYFGGLMLYINKLCKFSWSGSVRWSSVIFYGKAGTYAYIVGVNGWLLMLFLSRSVCVLVLMLLINLSDLM